MKKFEGNINGKVYTNEEEFNKALSDCNRTENMSVSYNYTFVPDEKVISKQTRDNIDEKKLSLKQIAALSHVSETHFRTLFRECYGCTPLQYLIDLRVQKALRLLKETDLPLSEIEGRCGFRDHAYFVKQFQKITESSPEDYRAKKK